MQKVDAEKSPARLFDVLMLTDPTADAIEFPLHSCDSGAVNKKI
jgi:hypothetical protein